MTDPTGGLVTAFDADLMLAYMDGETEIAIAMLGDLVIDMPERVAVLEAALRAGDLIAARREAHTLKGLAKGGGAQLLSDAAASIETACRVGALDDAARSFPAFKQIAERTQSDWIRYLQDSPH